MDGMGWVMTSSPTWSMTASPDSSNACTSAPSDRACSSEERRVGKECRSRCDWSSDVCSSDLHGRHGLGDDELADLVDDRLAGLVERLYVGPQRPGLQLGRASCRERV